MYRSVGMHCREALHYYTALAGTLGLYINRRLLGMLGLYEYEFFFLGMLVLL